MTLVVLLARWLTSNLTQFLTFAFICQSNRIGLLLGRHEAYFDWVIDAVPAEEDFGLLGLVVSLTNVCEECVLGADDFSKPVDDLC